MLFGSARRALWQCHARSMKSRFYWTEMICSIDHMTSIACAIAVITLGTWIQSSGAIIFETTPWDG